MMPFETGHLQEDATFVDYSESSQGKVSLVTSTPYATVTAEPMVDGYSGFIMLDKNGNPKVALHIENEMRWAMKKYKKLHPDSLLPHITSHVFRHTFCTNYANDGMDIKNLST